MEYSHYADLIGLSRLRNQTGSHFEHKAEVVYSGGHL